jgi:hypothetical protein
MTELFFQQRARFREHFHPTLSMSGTISKHLHLHCRQHSIGMLSTVRMPKLLALFLSENFKKKFLTTIIENKEYDFITESFNADACLQLLSLCS